MNHLIVGSSAIDRIGFDEAKREMEVRFKNGTTYRYSDVDPDDHAAFIAAESVGAHFGKHIRPKYEGRKRK